MPRTVQMQANPLAEDLDHVLDHTKDLWEELRGQSIFITGGTGFFGCWLLESFAWANDKLNLGAKALVLTRNPDAFRNKAPHLAAHPAIDFHIGDIKSFDYPKGEFSHVIHAATESSATLNDQNPLAMFDTIVNGTRRALDFACHCGARRFLLTSSGAVYGRQPSEITHVSEDYPGAPSCTDPRSAYGEGKRAAELLCAFYHKQHGLEPVIARCFAFVGPYLPLDAHFAIGNFLRDAMNGGPIRVNGDGTPCRSYLYAADLAVWLWTILMRGESGAAYNVGSEHDMSIATVAEAVAAAFMPRPGITIARHPVPDTPTERYVPAVQRATSELGLRVSIGLADAVARTLNFHWSLP
ncbi:MAG: NAD(P)-dependent oxidoreductase [bacterium]